METSRFEEIEDCEEIPALPTSSVPSQCSMLASLWGNAPAQNKDASPGSFDAFYGPVRAYFSANRSQLDLFGNSKDQVERTKFLLGTKCVKESLTKVSLLRASSLDSSMVPAPKQKPKEFLRAPPLAHGANKKYPHMSKAIEVKKSDKEGRYWVAKQRINPGDVLVVDQSYIRALFPEHYKTHCFYCFVRLTDSAMSCFTCDKVKFCSPDCRSQGYIDYHRWECPIMEYLDNDEIGKMALLAYRIVASTGFDELSKIKEKLDSTEATYTAGDYLSVFEQVPNTHKRTPGDLLKRSMMGVLLTRCLQLTDWFPPHLRSDLGLPEVLRITELIVRHIQSCSCNAYEINEYIKRPNSMADSQSIELGGAVYPTISLSNHACASNTSRTNYGTFCVVKAVSTIFQNDKIHDNYGHFYHTDPKEVRQKALSAQYFFDCACRACSENWPTYKEFRSLPMAFYCPHCKHPLGQKLEKLKKCAKCKKEVKGLAKLLRQIGQFDRDFRKTMEEISIENADKQLKYHVGLLQDLEKICKMPCKEIVSVQQVILQCYAVQGNMFNLPPEVVQPTVEHDNGHVDENDSDEDDDDDDDDDIPGLI